MKKIITILLLSILSSCTYMVLDVPLFDCRSDVAEWIGENINYCYDWESDNISVNHWQAPAETLALRTGDCDDMAILFIDILNTQGIDNSFFMEYITHNGVMLHYWAINKDREYFDYNSGFIYPDSWLEYKVLKTYTYEDIQEKLK